MSIMPQDPEDKTNLSDATRQGLLSDRDKAARAIVAGDRTGTASGLIASVAAAIAAERWRVLSDARAVVEYETSLYPGASPAVTSGIWGGFDQWAMACIEGRTDPARRQCGKCGQQHTDAEYADAHQNDEGGY